jgi:sulfate adenylyltransferase
MMREAADHSPEDYVILSGTRLREMLGEGIVPPIEVARPEVAEILMAHYQLEDAAKVA